MKKAVILCCICLLLLLAVSCAFTAASAATSGNCGTDATWNLNSSGTLTISGSGAIKDYWQTYDKVSRKYIPNTPWAGVRNKIKAVYISYGITAIGENAFFDCPKLERVTIPYSVKRIKPGAFKQCAKLTDITIPNSVTEIENEVFLNCAGLKKDLIPYNTTSIGESAFAGCTGLQSIRIPNMVKNISRKAFEGCTSLNSVTVYSGLTKIPDYAFSGCTGLATVILPETVTAIGKHAFSGCTSLTSLSLPVNIQTLSAYAFKNCTSLKKIKIPGALKTVGNFSFCGCSSLKDVEISSGVTKIGSGAFENSGITTLNLPKSVKTIGDYAFALTDIKEINYTGTRTQAQKIKINDPYNNLSGASWHYGYGHIPVRIVTEPMNVEVEEAGKTATVSVRATGDGLKYQWYFKGPKDTDFKKSSVKSAVYSLVMKKSANGRELYCAVTDKYGNTVRSQSARLLISDVFSIVLQPESVKVAKAGNSAYTAVTATGRDLKYQWFVKDPGQKDFIKSTVSSSTYSAKINESSNGRKVYCVITDHYGKEIKTKIVTLSIKKKLKITVQPENVSISKAGQSVKTSVIAAGDGLKYRWFFKDPESADFERSKVSGSTYSAKLTAEKNGRQVYCLVTDQYGNELQSKTVVLKIRKPVKITVQPENVKVSKNGDSAEVTVTATGDGLKYQWFVKDPGSDKYIESAIKQSVYSVRLTTEKSGRLVYCVITDQYGNQVKSKTVKLTIR